MQVLILAAGFGTRLKPLTDHMPKALVPVCGKPLLERALNFFRNQGYPNLGINSHYMHQSLQAFQERSAIPFELFHEEGHIRGTGGALFFARDFLEKDDTFCISNVDILSNADIKKLERQFIDSKSVLCLVATPTIQKPTLYFDPTTFEYCGTPYDSFGNSQSCGAEFCGIAMYKKEVLQYVKPDDFSVIPLWHRLKDASLSVRVIIDPTLQWFDTGTANDLSRIHFSVLDGTFKLDIPEEYTIDLNRKIGYETSTLSAHDLTYLSTYVWIDPCIKEQMSPMDHTIVLSQSTIQNKPLYSHCILTPWGGMHFDKTTS